MTMKFIKNTLKGKGVVGQLIYGVADLLPFPNVLNVYRAVVKERPYLSRVEVAIEVVGRLDIVRFIPALILAYFIATGKITVETAKDILTLF